MRSVEVEIRSASVCTPDRGRVCSGRAGVAPCEHTTPAPTCSGCPT